MRLNILIKLCCIVLDNFIRSLQLENLTLHFLIERGKLLIFFGELLFQLQDFLVSFRRLLLLMLNGQSLGFLRFDHRLDLLRLRLNDFILDVQLILQVLG